MTRARFRIAVAILVLAATAGVGSAAFAYRQYYSPWKKHSGLNYHYRSYYYKPHANYSGYKHHYVIFHPQKPKHVYFYNPYKKQYWGRCPIDHGGKSLYSELAEKDRKGSLGEIPESAFPAPTKTPPIPESTDNEPLDLPPDDLPSNEPGAPADK